MRVRSAIILAFLLVPGAGRAQELSVLMGRMEALNTSESSRSWQVDFRYNPTRHFGWSASYLNEGHVKDHKRDGVATQAWVRIPLFGRRVSLDLGAGPYYFFDTATRPDGSFADDHGWAAIYTASATYYTKSPWIARIQANHIKAPGGLDTNTYVVGAGYHLWREDRHEAGSPGQEPGAEAPQKTGDEVMLFVGQTVVNSLEDQKGIASGIEFRKGVVRHLDWTLTWLNEGDPEVIRRNGIGSQLWLVDSYLDDRFVIGAGAGGYFFLDTKRPPRPGTEGSRDLAFLLTLTTGYRFADRWFARFNWNRVLVDYNTDTDVFVMGVGFRWKD